MILVEITKDGIEKVWVRAVSEAEQDVDLKIWPLVRRRLNRLNQEILRQQDRNDGAPIPPQAA